MSSTFLNARYADIHPYQPGEQPKDRAYVKLNANETSLPPSPAVRAALSDALVNGLGRYADSHCMPLREAVAAISVGIVALPGAAPACVLDLDYQEDSGCETDMNVVMTASGGLVEIQGTAEGAPFSRQQASELLDLAAKGIDELVRLQRAALQEEGA